MHEKKSISTICCKNIKRIRKKRGYSCVKLGRLAGVNPSTISLLETGKRAPSIEIAEKIARGLDVEFIELLLEKIEDNEAENKNGLVL